MKRCFPTVEILLLAAALLFAFSSCRKISYEDLTPIDEDTLREVREQIAWRQNPANAGENDVFFTPGGSVYHATAECSSLARSKIVVFGTIGEAALQGKRRPCSRCFKSAS